MSDDVTLKPCPMCGGTETTEGGENRMYSGVRYWIGCGRCGARGPSGKTREEARKSWNTRVPDPALAAAQQRIAE
jgi:Lar family restriction alleviation protein